jgi:hypothetical protein
MLRVYRKSSGKSAQQEAHMSIDMCMRISIIMACAVFTGVLLSPVFVAG